MTDAYSVELLEPSQPHPFPQSLASRRPGEIAGKRFKISSFPGDEQGRTAFYFPLSQIIVAYCSEDNVCLPCFEAISTVFGLRCPTARALAKNTPRSKKQAHRLLKKKPTTP